MIALVREVSPELASCELTHLDRNPIDPAVGVIQHAEYVDALAASGCTIRWLPPAPSLPDSVFVEDTAVVLDELAVITRPGAESRRAEVPPVATVLEEYRPIHRIVGPGTLDGGDVMRAGHMLYVGQTPRTNAAGIQQLRDIVAPAGYEVRAVPVNGCLHLKSAVSWLEPGTLLINREWVPDSTFKGFRFVDVDPAEPFAGNALVVADTVIHPIEFARTRARLVAARFTVRTVPASELAKAEGGVTCCSLIFSSVRVRS